ncbi:MAG: dicarboxylate/amino acid:cation symporter [Leptospiraceae bacterium]|nr:dicarboxylate/amino acid:cation symporter [Leptospiraceae bacterium]
MKLKLNLQTKILLGMLLGALFGSIAIHYRLVEFTSHWVKPFGSIFISLLKAIAVPLVFVSLVKGIASLSDISRLSRLSIRTITLYMSTTVIAISFGLILVNIVNPGNTFSQTKKEELRLKFADTAQKKTSDAMEAKKRPPLQFLLDIIPDNMIKAAADNSKMLQIIFVAILFGISMILLPDKQVLAFKNLIDSLNEIILKVIDLIMLYAPIGVFALISSLLVEFGGDNLSDAVDLFIALGAYSLTVIVGLLLMLFFIYPSLIFIFTKVKPLHYLKSVIPIQMVAFSTSSSAATLPVTMEHCEKSLGVSKEVTSFVLPIGATINMDGTGLYQSVSAVFIAQVFGYDLTIQQQLNIILTATLASVGTAGVPGAGIVMLVIVLNSIGIATEGIALIFAVERILDMFRTVVNVTGDAAVAVIVDSKDKQKSNG